MTDPERLPLLGLLADAVLPGETHVLAASALDPGTFAAVKKAKPERLLALAVRTSAELPSFVSSRVGTVCDVVRIDEETIELRGVRRARILRASAGAPPTAKLEPGPEDGTAEVVLGALTRLLAASPQVAEAPDEVLSAARAILRSVAPQSALRAAMEGPLESALEVASETVAS